jgi:hypothetical protein
MNRNEQDILAVPGDVAASSREKLARARADQARRAEERAAEKEAAELEHFDLVSRFEKELGVLDRAFTIVDLSELGEGFVVLKLGEGVLWKTFVASKMDVVDTEAFVLPNVVHPSQDTYRDIARRRGFVATRCANALAELYGVKRKEDAGK